MGKKLAVTFAVGICLSLGLTVPTPSSQTKESGAFRPSIPKTWDDMAMAELEVPLADPIGSPKHVSADYYYKIPVRPIYRSYPVYAPGHEPPSYLDRLKQQDPVIVWDDKGHRPPLKTKADWIQAGETVFSSAIAYDFLFTPSEIRDKSWYEKTGMALTHEGVLPFVSYVVRQKGKVELGSFSCAQCHTRVMPGGKVLKGAQGNIPDG